MSGIRSGLRLIPEEFDQIVRLAQFKAAHPDQMKHVGTLPLGVGRVLVF